MMARWSWRRVESIKRDTERYELVRDGGTTGILEMHGSIPNPSLVLGPLCDALAGTTATKPDTPLGNPVPDERPLTDKQRAKIHLDLAELDPRYRERPRRLAAISRIIERDIGSTNELTLSEASIVIDRIEQALKARKTGAA